MKQRKIFIWSIIGMLIAFLLDKPFVYLMQHLEIELLNQPIMWITSIYFVFVVLIVMGAAFMWNEKKYEYMLPLILSFCVAIGVAYLLKYIIMRPRPFIELGVRSLVILKSYSFPSAHAAAVFSAMAILDKEFPKMKWIWLTIAVVVALSRLYIGVHYLSDVIAGGILGYFVGLVIIAAEERFKPFMIVKKWFIRLQKR